MTDLERSGGSPDVIVVVRGLVKYLGRTRILDGADLTVRRGEVHGLMGLAGSGKTTVLQTLLGRLHPDQGEVVVLGVTPWRETAALLRRLAAVEGEANVWPDLTGGELIDLYTQMHGGIDLTKRDDLLGLFDVDPARQGYTYSTAERQKLALVGALASSAELLVLDEPMAGLDPVMQRAFRDWLATHRQPGQTVLFASRVLAEAESLADRVSILHNGRIAETGTVADLRHLTRTAITAELDRPDPTVAAMPAVHNVDMFRDTVRCDVDSDQVASLLRRLLDSGLRSLTCRPPTLEELLHRLNTESAARREP